MQFISVGMRAFFERLAGTAFHLPGIGRFGRFRGGAIGFSDIPAGLSVLSLMSGRAGLGAVITARCHKNSPAILPARAPIKHAAFRDRAGKQKRIKVHAAPQGGYDPAVCFACWHCFS